MYMACALAWWQGRENEGVRWFREAVGMRQFTAKYNLGVALLWQAKNGNKTTGMGPFDPLGIFSTATRCILARIGSMCSVPGVYPCLHPVNGWCTR